MLDSLSYNQFWGIFFTGSFLLLVFAFYWLFNPQRKYYLMKLKEEENKKK